MSVAKQEADVQQAAAKPFTKGKFLTGSDIGLAVGIIIILTVLFLPVPAVVLDIGLAFSIAFSVLILMVALWIAPARFFGLSNRSADCNHDAIVAQYCDDARDSHPRQ